MGPVNRAIRFLLPCVACVGFAVFLIVRLVLLHLGQYTVKEPRYDREYKTNGLRGSIFPAQGAEYPVAQSVPEWTYHIDTSVLTTNRSVEQSARTLSEVLGIPYEQAYNACTKKVGGVPSRYAFLARSTDTRANEALVQYKAPFGLVIEDHAVRQYPLGRHMSHIIGYVSRDPTNAVGAAGIEQRYERYLKAVPGLVRGTQDANRREIYDHRLIFAAAADGKNVFLTIDRNIQCIVEEALRDGVATNGAVAAWSIVMDVKTGAVLAMASLPDYDPSDFPHYDANAKKNRAIAENYEPGSVMKVITAAAAIDAGIVSPDTMYNTQKADPRYYRLPGDAGHKWEPLMSIRDAIVHSSNIVIGKLGVDLGPKRLRAAMVKFGFGAKTGIELPGEELGILPPLPDWQRDKIKWSRAPIGQGVAVTAIQLAGAYAAIGNDGVRMKPYLVDKILSQTGDVIYQSEPTEVDRPIRAETAVKVREMMLGVAKKGGTARRAAVIGYTVAGKTGTAQMREGKGYSATAYNASFIGLFPASKPQIVILVTFQNPVYCRRLGERVPIFNHQGGICAAPVFRRIAQSVAHYLSIEPDNPDEIPEEDE